MEDINSNRVDHVLNDDSQDAVGSSLGHPSHQTSLGRGAIIARTVGTSS